jgi:chromosome segregation ATPase
VSGEREELSNLLKKLSDELAFCRARVAELVTSESSWLSERRELQLALDRSSLERGRLEREKDECLRRLRDALDELRSWREADLEHIPTSLRSVSRHVDV